jgi:hypothetical protein
MFLAYARALLSRAFGACGMYSRSGVRIQEEFGGQKAAKRDTNGLVVACVGAHGQNNISNLNLSGGKLSRRELHFLRGIMERAKTKSKAVSHPCHCSWVSLFFVVKVRHTHPARHISSISPLSTPSLTSLHLSTQTSPRFSSTVPAPCSPCTST